MSREATRVEPIHTTSIKVYPDGWTLHLDWACYHHPDGTQEYGYRFSWANPAGQRQPLRGQARIPSRVLADRLWAQATVEGWGHLDENHLPAQNESEAA